MEGFLLAWKNVVTSMEVHSKAVYDLTQEPRTQVHCGDSAKTMMIMIMSSHISSSFPEVQPVVNKTHGLK